MTLLACKFPCWTLDWDENKMSIYIVDVLINELGTVGQTVLVKILLEETIFVVKPYSGLQWSKCFFDLYSRHSIIDYARVYQLDKDLA
jgi:hypothetical protein